MQSIRLLSLPQYSSETSPFRCFLFLFFFFLFVIDPGSTCQTGSSKVGEAGLPLLQLETKRDVGRADGNELQVVVWEAISVAEDFLRLQESSEHHFAQCYHSCLRYFLGKNIGKEGKVYNQGEGNREKLEDLSLRVCLVGRGENRKGGVVHHLTREMRNEAVVLSLMLFASSIPVVKEVEAIVDPASFTVVRFALAAIPFVPFVLRAQDDVDTRNAGIELGFWVSLGYLLQALGLLTSDAGRATFLSMLTVIVVPLLDGMLGAVVPTRTWFGALMSVLGVAMLECSGSPPCVGDLLNFLSALFFGVHMLRTEHIARNTKKEKFLPLLGYEVCVVAVFSTIWYLVGGFSGGFQEYNPSMWTWAKFWDWMVSFPWVPAVYTGIFSSGLCLWGESTSLSFYKITIIVVVTILNVSSNSSFTISVNENAQTEQMAAMRDVSATETAIIYALEPVWGGGFAWFLLGERWGTAGWVGAALVLGGSLTVQICGSSPEDSCEDDTGGAKLENGRVSSNEKGLSASPVIISSKDISDLLK
ncbi:hypothetical protein TIFTF001_038881 [Ficus carica]|uniref:EamA domain-containing protein n=1 Tax=Ficus carica TaxID=3494 RepID=A0AA88E826_FICCA|nr:hypothetical protein TIFTF001_038879 [Ficus carica]GMN69837.1 hypothetical protein TIFTF001_038881 [Ficus carica]